MKKNDKYITKQYIDPVTKIRVTEYAYIQPTKAQVQRSGNFVSPSKVQQQFN